MRILVAEPIAREGVELLRGSHDVDERHGLSRDELCAILPDYDALVVATGKVERPDRGGHACGHRRAGVCVDNGDLEQDRTQVMVATRRPGKRSRTPSTACAVYGCTTDGPRMPRSAVRWKAVPRYRREMRGRTSGPSRAGKIGQA